MKMDLYWPEHKVFFVATLALFPNKLDGHEVNQWFYRPYFVAKDPDFIELELEEYRKAGYLKYEKPTALYKISEINAQKAAADLTEYLKKWQRNELLSLSADKPPDTAHQQVLLLNAISRTYTKQKEPRISLQDVYGKTDSSTYEPPFWELVLSCQLIDNKVKIKYMDYSRRDDGLYDDNAQPLVDFKIIDKKLVDLVEQRVAQQLKSELPTAPANIDATIKQRAWLTMPDKFIFVELDSNKLIKINKHELRTDLAPYSLMKRLLEHPTIPVSLEAAKKLDGCEDVHNLSEIIRQCGFNEAKKKMFFETSTSQKVKLKKDVYLSPDDIALLAK